MFSLYEIQNRITCKTKMYVDHYILYLASRNALLCLFFLHPCLRPTWALCLSLAPASQNKAEHRWGLQEITELTLYLVTFSFTFLLPSSKLREIQYLLGPFEIHTVLFPSSYSAKNAIYSFAFFKQLFSAPHSQQPTSVLVWLWNTCWYSPRYPCGCLLYPPMCLDFHECQHWEKQVKKLVMSQWGGHTALRWDPELWGWGDIWSVWLWWLTNQCDTTFYEKVKFH